MRELPRVSTVYQAPTDRLQTHVVTQAIESTLLATGQSLYKAIACNPPSWLTFGDRIRSKVIFKEALIHAAGQFNTPLIKRALYSGRLPDDVVAILIHKADVIKDAVRAAERHFASYYPQLLMREKPSTTGDRQKISRANYSNDIITWIAVNLFRHWCCDMVVADKTHHAQDLGWHFISVINSGGESYLPMKQLTQGFHARFPMSSKGASCLQHRLTEIKESVKQWTNVSLSLLPQEYHC